MNAYAVAGTVICLLGLVMLAPTYIQQLRTYIQKDHR